MPTIKVKCPTCNGLKDKRAKQCSPCQKRDNPVRETGLWSVSKSHGYLEKRINGTLWLQHRWVMQQHLGRPLEDGEVVHHIDGDKTNNNIDNLELHTTHSEHMKEHATPERMKELSMLGHKARWGYE